MFWTLPRRDYEKSVGNVGTVEQTNHARGIHVTFIANVGTVEQTNHARGIHVTFIHSIYF